MTSPFPQIDSPPQAAAEVLVNEALETLQHQAVYGKDHSNTSGLIWGYYGGRWGGFSVAASTFTLTSSTTNYLVVALATGVHTASTSATNWNDDTNYARAYKLTTSVSAVTAVEDHRAGPSGVHGGSGGTGGGGGGGMTGLAFTSSTTTTDSDPGTGVLRWNNATQASATILYIDNADADSTSLVTFWASLQSGTFLKITDAADADVWQLWKVNATPTNGTGYYKFAVTLQAQEGGNIANATDILLDVDASGASTSGTVTHTGGALTANAVVLGAGTDDAKVVAGVTTDGTSALNLGVAGASVGKVVLANATSGTITVQPPTGALGTVTVTIPAATDTLANLAGSQALTNKTYNGNTLTAGTFTITGTAGKTLTFSNSLTLAGTDGKTLTVSNSLTLAGTDSTTMTFPPASASIGYLNIPQNSQSANYTTVLADAGKHLFHPAADTNARTFTIDSNANVAYAVGTAITFVNETSQVLSIAITSDTLTLGGSTSTGTRSLAQNGVATAIKVTTTKWIITGTGLT